MGSRAQREVCSRHNKIAQLRHEDVRELYVYSPVADLIRQPLQYQYGDARERRARISPQSQRTDAQELREKHRGDTRRNYILLSIVLRSASVQHLEWSPE
jgi:hypothetical protein